MSVSGTNQAKNIVSPYGARKAGIYTWGDSLATWGDALATWGGITITPTNQTKTAQGNTYLVTSLGDFLVTDEGDYLVTSIGGSVVNQSKS